MQEDQYSIGEWADAAFPSKTGTVESVKAQAKKLLEEAAELAHACGVSPMTISRHVSDKCDCLVLSMEESDNAKVGPEAADVGIVLAVLCHRGGLDLNAHINAKMDRNRARKWSHDENGLAQHVKESDAKD